MKKTGHLLLIATVLVFSTSLSAQPKSAGKANEGKAGGTAAATGNAKGVANSQAGGKASDTTPGNSENRAATQGKGPAVPTAGNPPGLGEGKSDGKSNANASNANASNANASNANASNANASKADAEKGEAKPLSDNASENAKAVQSVIEKFESQRNQYLAERKALLEKLKTASATEKKVIAEQLRAETQAREDEERALAKQIREELKTLRADRKSGGN